MSVFSSLAAASGNNEANNNNSAEKEKEKKSVTAVTVFVHLAVSAILESRAIFPASAYDVVPVGSGAECPRLATKTAGLAPKLAGKVAEVNAWILEGLHEAIEKRFLKSATLAILDASGASLEHYVFRFDYPCSETVHVSVDNTTSQRAPLPDQLREVLSHLSFFAAHQDALDSSAKYFALKIAKTRLASPGYAPKQFVPCAASDLSSFSAKNELASLKVGEFAGESHALRVLYKGPPVNFETNETNNANTLDSTPATSPKAAVTQDDDETRLSAGEATRRDYEESLFANTYNNSVRNEVVATTSSKKRPAVTQGHVVSSSQDSEDWTHGNAKRYAKSRRLLSF